MLAHSGCQPLHIIVSDHMILFLIVFPLDNVQCGVHFTDQQYTIDPVSGNVTVEWEGTGPDAFVLDMDRTFTCGIDAGARFTCKFDRSTNALWFTQQHILW